MYNRNAAYDFGALEKQKRKGQIVELPGRRARQKEKLKTKRKVLTAAFSAFMIVAATVSALVMGQVILTEKADQKGKAEIILNELESSNTQLQMELEANGSSKAPANDSVHNEVVKIPKETLTETH